MNAHAASTGWRAGLQRTGSVLSTLLLSALVACSPALDAPADPGQAYADAVADARDALPSEISRDLTPIAAHNPRLIWENGVVGSRVLVVTWIGDAGRYYQCNIPTGCAGNMVCLEGGECPTYRYDSWVTVVPEIRDFFAGAVPTPMRIAQLLGLPPEAATPGHPREYKYMLELWVSPKDLFRPCPDSEISDTTCELSMPADAFRVPDLAQLVRASAGPAAGTFMSYPDWFANQSRYSYTADANPYPWTRLGYTYDWGSGNHVGLSEFVVRGARADGTTIPVGIRSVRRTADYFAQ